MHLVDDGALLDELLFNKSNRSFKVSLCNRFGIKLAPLDNKKNLRNKLVRLRDDKNNLV